jgi:hypothetical protein
MKTILSFFKGTILYYPKFGHRPFLPNYFTLTAQNETIILDTMLQYPVFDTGYE